MRHEITKLESRPTSVEEAKRVLQKFMGPSSARRLEIFDRVSHMYNWGGYYSEGFKSRLFIVACIE
jgi:hypothetical protein